MMGIIMEGDTIQLWDTCLRDIEGQITKANFSTWFKQTSINKIEDGIVTVAVPNEFVREWMLNKYQRLILKSIVDQDDRVRGVEFVIGRLAPAQSHKEPIPVYKQELPIQDLYVNRDDNLNPRYTFDRFVVGPFNELAYAASQAVVKHPEHAYNPLFIYGGSGLGKTHLIQSVGNEVKRLFPEKRVLYTSLEQFSNEYVTSVRNNRLQAFRAKYQKYDILIMDDIQFISGKEGTQNELFHLFNLFYEQNKNIIFSSDKHPNHIIGLEDRLKTRFNAGMTIDVQAPDLESRLAILKEKMAHGSLSLPDDALIYIASVITGSIRELEGVINLVTMHSSMKQTPLTLVDIKLLVKNSIKPKKTVSIDSVVRSISMYYNLEEQSIYQKTRRKDIVRARQIIMFVLREDFNESYPAIGTKMGGKDHTTVIHSYEKIKKELPNDPHLMKEIEDIRILFK